MERVVFNERNMENKKMGKMVFNERNMERSVGSWLLKFYVLATSKVVSGRSTDRVRERFCEERLRL